MNLTGGISWHWMAWRSQTRWAPTADAIEQWLLQSAQALPSKYKLEKPSLLLIGASAGWMMSSHWLSQFARVDTFDIDPLAAFLFKWRHGAALKAQNTALECHTQDALQNLPVLLEAHPNACVFFDNVLGQMRFQHAAADWQLVEKKIQHFKVQLKGREWGSIHDRMSGRLNARIAVDSALPIRQPEWNEQHWLTQLDAQSPWLDHLTQNVFAPGSRVQDFAWNFSPIYRHWLQAAWVRP
jgi:hypothetical protein